MCSSDLYLRIGVHWDIEVAGATPEQVVSQACCAALPVGLGAAPREAWSAFARLILEATYESTLCAAVINAKQTGVRTVLLTQVGAGALGNDPVWILDAMRRALRRFHNVQLDVRIVTRDTPTSALARLAHEMSEV